MTAAKQFACKDIGMACPFMVRAATEDELMMHVASHAAKVHGMKEVPADVKSKMQKAIRIVQV
jgi:predicted small metal-binding protein